VQGAGAAALCAGRVFHKALIARARPSALGFAGTPAKRCGRRSRAEGEGSNGRWTSLKLAWEPRILSILRIMTGAAFLQHGLNKFFNFPPAATQRPYDPLYACAGLAGILEVGGGILLGIRPVHQAAAFILSGEMAFAYFMAHAPRAFYPYSNGGTLAVLYCFVFLYLWLAGGGEWSLDRLLRRGAASTSGTAARGQPDGQLRIPDCVRKTSAA